MARQEGILPFVTPPDRWSALRKHAPENYLYTGINAFIVPFGGAISILHGDVKSQTVKRGVLNQNKYW